MKFLINYGGSIYEIDDTEEVYEHILSDSEFATNYFEEILFAKENCSGTENTTQSRPEHFAVSKNAESSWDHKATLLFLEECLKRKTDLRNVKIRRRTVFLEIQRVMMTKASYNFSDRSLDKKLQNMKSHYNKILDNNNKKSTGRGRMTWPYFELMCQIYAEEARVRDCPTFESLSPLNFGECIPEPNFDCAIIVDDSPTPSPCTSPSDLPSTSKAAQTKISRKYRPTKVDAARQEVLILEREKIALGKAHLDAMLKLVALKEKEMELLEKKINWEIENKKSKEKEDADAE